MVSIHVGEEVQWLTKVSLVTNFGVGSKIHFDQTRTIAAYQGLLGKAWRLDGMQCLQEKRCTVTGWLKVCGE
jgi:hypothetical protein